MVDDEDRRVSNSPFLPRLLLKLVRAELLAASRSLSRKLAGLFAATSELIRSKLADIRAILRAQQIIAKLSRMEEKEGEGKETTQEIFFKLQIPTFLSFSVYMAFSFLPRIGNTLF